MHRSKRNSEKKEGETWRVGNLLSYMRHMGTKLHSDCYTEMRTIWVALRDRSKDILRFLYGN